MSNHNLIGVSNRKNALFADAQSILHNCLRVLAGNDHAVLGNGAAKITLERRPGENKLKITLGDGVEVLDIVARGCPDKMISFEGTRYATENLYRLRVSRVWSLRRGVWIEKLREEAKRMPEPFSPDDILFEPVDDAYLWE